MAEQAPTTSGRQNGQLSPAGQWRWDSAGGEWVPNKGAEPNSGVGPGGITLVAPETTGSTSTSLYGLGQWGDQTVDPGDLPFLSSIIATGQTTTGDAIVRGFASASPGDVATIQHALLMAGYYTANYTPRYGVVGPQDVAAFGHLVTTAGQSGQPVAALLVQGAAYGAQAGIAAAQAETQGAAKVAQVRLPNATTLEAAATAAFQKELGHKAGPQEAAAFAAAYRAMSAGMQRTANQAMYDATTPDQTIAGGVVGNPQKLVERALTTPEQRLAMSQQNNPNLSPILAHELGTGHAPPEIPPASLSDQIGGLMKLGQDITDPGSAAPTGLTQIETETPVDPRTAAINYARNAHPNAAAANDVANVFDLFLNLLSGVG